MKRKIIALILISCCISVGTPAFATANNPSSATNPPRIVSINRLSGHTRYETAKVISENYCNDKVKNVILSTGNEFADTSIYSIADITATVNQSEDYSFPTTIQAKLYNSDTIDVPVEWNSKLVDTSSLGSSAYDGVVDGYSKAIKLNLTVREPIVDTVTSSGLIAQYSTQFDSTLVKRTANIRLAVQALDGKLLAPGERFSFNESVGERTVKAGYQEALIIVGNKFTPGLGGGVCQVSSNLYNVVLLANLEILERHRHSLPVDYVPPGQDATVSFPILDFRFRNSRDAYLLMRCKVEGNTLTFQLYRKAEK